jgi:hypothetical protein
MSISNAIPGQEGPHSMTLMSEEDADYRESNRRHHRQRDGHREREQGESETQEIEEDGYVNKFLQRGFMLPHSAVWVLSL